ncbi:uncharacterized protein ARMOST_04111 [Armillaria ostoyae]|uniref:Uncharacterized protein n=1 Tax=Armillaria ostoyae TaxID=47428 RepID=A0A284QWE2_ARMOS|nr:uncharacterized protein ARMOST_04111 [Armillaria ostoyae]
MFRASEDFTAVVYVIPIVCGYVLNFRVATAIVGAGFSAFAGGSDDASLETLRFNKSSPRERCIVPPL